jgi:RNA polymerase sigma factor (sigma-70 family)
MKLTEKHLREFFPRDMRFVHFVARRYGLSFHNDEAVEKANFYAQRDIIKIYNKGIEFENKEHLYGYVMNAIRYSILRSYKKLVNEENLDIRPESDYIYGDGEEQFSKMESYTPPVDIDYDDCAEDTYQMLSKTLSPIEAKVLHLRYKKDLKPKEIANELDTTTYNVKKISFRIITKYNKLTNRIKSKEYEYSLENKNALQSVQQAERRLQEQTQRQSSAAYKEKRKCYNETMSWLNLD